MAANPQHITEQPSGAVTPSPHPIAPLISIDIYLSLALSIGAAGVSTLAIKRVVELTRQISQRNVISLLPAREQQRVRDLLAQLAILAKADRVALGVFFDGKFTPRGYHFERMAVPICYSRPNMPLLPELGKEVDVSQLERELGMLWREPSHEVVISKDSMSSECPDCLLYLERRNLQAIRLHLLHQGNTELAILGLHYQSGDGAINKDVTSTIKRIQTELTEIVANASLQKKMSKL